MVLRRRSDDLWRAERGDGEVEVEMMSREGAER
jgi:hypothetical protein